MNVQPNMAELLVRITVPIGIEDTTHGHQQAFRPRYHLGRLFIVTVVLVYDSTVREHRRSRNMQ